MLTCAARYRHPLTHSYLQYQPHHQLLDLIRDLPENFLALAYRIAHLPLFHRQMD